MSSRRQTIDRPASLQAVVLPALPRVIAMLLLFTAAGVLEAKHTTSLSALSNSDVWWHLRTGLWILQNHAVPHTSLFSQAPDQPWSAANWAYEFLFAGLFRVLDLCALPFLLVVFRSAFAVVAFLLAGGWKGRFWPAIALSALTQYILGGLQAGPTYCSIIFFGLELLLLFEFRRTGKHRFLFWLPPLFLLWANIDIQFVFGILLLALFLLATLLEDAWHLSGILPLEPGSPRLSKLGMAAALSVIATLLNPYTYHLYAEFLAIVTSSVNLYLPDSHAMGFRRPQDYALMLLTMTAFLALGLRRSRDPFKILLMIGSTLISFYAQRDAWIVALASIAVIGDELRAANETSVPQQNSARTRELLFACGISVVAVVLAAAMFISRRHETLLSNVAQTYPVDGCDYIRGHNLPRPLFNFYDWGGFVAWYLPEYPVAIDSRPSLYTDDLLVQYFKAMNADIPYKEFSAMDQGSTLLLPAKSLMGQALISAPAFRVAYKDEVSVVLVRNYSPN